MVIMKRYLQPEIELHPIQDISKQERNNYHVIELITKLWIEELYITKKKKKNVVWKCTE